VANRFQAISQASMMSARLQRHEYAARHRARTRFQSGWSLGGGAGRRDGPATIEAVIRDEITPADKTMRANSVIGPSHRMSYSFPSTIGVLKSQTNTGGETVVSGMVDP
jgi:hypothetical protein